MTKEQMIALAVGAALGYYVIPRVVAMTRTRGA